jgi:hypothetical protein
MSEHRGPLISAGTLLAIGLGGFVDGILLHQILQWHNMLSSRIVPIHLAAMKYNMVWDGLFHAFTWIVTVIGLALLWQAGRSRPSAALLRTRSRDHLVGPDAEALEGVGSERRGDRDVGRVAAAGDQDASDAGDVVSRIERVPGATEVGLEPSREVHRRRVLGNADVTEIAGAIARRDVQAATEGNGQVREVAADALAVDRLGAVGCDKKGAYVRLIDYNGTHWVLDSAENKK